MTNYLQRKPGSIEELAAKMSSNIKEDEYQKLFKKELEKAGKGIGAMTPAEKKAFFNKIDSMYKGKNEAVDNPYAVGMAQAMKATGDKPPLKKSTITKAHDIAKSIKKDEMKEETLDEGVLEKILKISKSNQPEDVKDAKGRVIKKLTPKGAEKFLKSLKDPLTGKSIFDRLPKSKGPTGWLSDYNKSGYGVITKGQTEKQLIDKLKSFREEVNESDAYDNDRFAIVNGKAKVDNANTPDKANHVYAPNAKTAEAMYKQGVKKFLDTTAMRNKFPTYKEEVNEEKVECPKCEGKGCEHCDMKGYHIKEAKVDELTAAQKKLPPALQKAIKKKEDAKEEVEETHSFVTNKQNQKQKDAKGEKNVVDPQPKIKKPSMNEETAKQQSLMKSIYDVWTNSAEELEEMKKSAKYMKASKTDVDVKADVEEEETVKEANINTDNVKKGDSAKEKELKIKLDKEKDTDALEKQLVAAQAQIGLLKQKLENEKHRAIKPEPNPETGEVPLTVGVAYKHLKDKMKKEESDEKDEKSDEKKKTMVGTKKTPVETKPSVDYNM